MAIRAPDGANKLNLEEPQTKYEAIMNVSHSLENTGGLAASLSMVAVAALITSSDWKGKLII